MAKRRTAVNDIIFELDNDSELSSEDEVKQPKMSRIKGNNSPNSTTQSDSNTQSSCLEIIDVDSSIDKINETLSPKAIRNGGKSPTEYIIVDEISESTNPNTTVSEIEKGKKFVSDNTFSEDIIVDSPASSSDPGVVGCENRTPLITVKFRDNKIAMNYKKKIKEFMLNLIKIHGDTPDSDNETDLELDIWPEDLSGRDLETEESADNLFFVDTDPSDMPVHIPNYSQNTTVISNNQPTKETPAPAPMLRRGPMCFNCNGQHTIRECREPRNNARINENRKAMSKKGRYHVEDEQKYGHLVPGRISGQLRNALGLKQHELPLYIYRMRELGYPPGWLEEARISHSGITLFDSSGQATLDPEDEEGELCEPGSKDKYDIKKILDFPGFNVPASSRYKEEAHKLGLPPPSEADSKLAMLSVLAPNAMKAYKRKKLTFFPSAAGGSTALGTAEMDIDSGDEVAEFPSQPPLPDDVPPPPPPPPDVPPPPGTPPPLPKDKPTNKTTPSKDKPDKQHKSPKDKKSPKKIVSPDNSQSILKVDSDDDIEVVAVMEVADIPVPVADMITIDVDGDVSDPESGLASPSLDDLEAKKRLLLDALGTESAPSDVESKEQDNKDGDTDTIAITDVDTEDGSQTEAPSDIEVVDDKVDQTSQPAEEDDGKDAAKDSKVDESNNEEIDVVTTDKPADVEMLDDKASQETEQTQNDINSGSSEKTESESSQNSQPVVETDSTKAEIPQATSSKVTVEFSTPNAKETISTDVSVPTTPTSAMGQVRETAYGTPVINVASPFMKLPSDDKFAKDICDVINFENLPNSVGKYKQISTLLKKVKSEVDRIQES